MLHVEEFLKHLENRDYRAYTRAAYRKVLARFAAYCGQNGFLDINTIGRKEVLEYIQSLGSKDRMTQAAVRQISRLRTYFRFLEDKGLLFESPLRGYDPPEIPEAHYPILTQKQMRDILERIPVAGSLAVKARAILELAYSSALRPRELYNLKLSDVDFEKGLLFLEQSKGRKDRVVPVGAQALAWLERYIREVRPRYLKDLPHESVFVSHKTGRPLTVHGVRWAIQESLRRTGFAPIKTYSLRGSAATHLLQQGMGVLPISKLLGHVKIQTTLYYLQFPLRELKAELSRKHPRGRMESGLRNKKGIQE
jgi:integrase/recombinase XerD